jgi:hypothetical protein
MRSYGIALILSIIYKDTKLVSFRWLIDPSQKSSFPRRVGLGKVRIFTTLLHQQRSSTLHWSLSDDPKPEPPAVCLPPSPGQVNVGLAGLQISRRMVVGQYNAASIGFDGRRNQDVPDRDMLKTNRLNVHSGVRCEKNLNSRITPQTFDFQ